MKRITSTIGNVSEKIKTGKTPPTKVEEYFNGEVSWFTPGDFKESTILKESIRTISDKALHDKKAVVFDANTVLVTCIGEIGKVGLVTERCSCNQQITGIKLRDYIYPKFFVYWCKAHKQLLEGQASNAVVPILNNAILSKIAFEFPESIDDQKRIAYLLSKVEGLIAQRKQNLQQLDDLLKSVFLEMFGDPVRNEKEWEKKPCSKIVEITTGHPFKSDFYTDDQTQIRLCGGLIIYPQGIEWDKCNYWPKELLPGLEQYLLEANDIVLAMDRPWISSGLKICTVDKIGCGSLLVQRTARLRAKGIEQYFLYAHLKDLSFTRHCKPTETTVPHISIKDIRTFQVLCPPKQLQIKFALIAEKVEGIKTRYQASLADLENLYGALSQKAFKGELDLSRVPLPPQPLSSP